MPGKRDRGTGAKATKAEEAFDAIRQQIERGTLPGGAKLTLQSLSDELQMSLTPIREALRMLQAHGLVEALIVLVPFGIGLAWLRDRTTSVLPGMLVHGLFNAAALAFVVVS